jgi:hypothetical protein
MLLLTSVAVIGVYVAHLFEITDSDTVSDAWLITVNLLDILEQAQQLRHHYNLEDARLKVGKVYALAEAHGIDKNNNSNCSCGLSYAEHALLRRKMIRFFKLQIDNLKHLIY